MKLQAYPLKDVIHLLQKLKEFRVFMTSSNNSFYYDEEQTNRDSRRQSITAKNIGIEAADAIYSSVIDTITGAERLFRSSSETRGFYGESKADETEQQLSPSGNGMITDRDHVCLWNLFR